MELKFNKLIYRLKFLEIENFYFKFKFNSPKKSWKNWTEFRAP